MVKKAAVFVAVLVFMVSVLMLAGKTALNTGEKGITSELSNIVKSDGVKEPWLQHGNLIRIIAEEVVANWILTDHKPCFLVEADDFLNMMNGNLLYRNTPEGTYYFCVALHCSKTPQEAKCIRAYPFPDCSIAQKEKGVCILVWRSKKGRVTGRWMVRCEKRSFHACKTVKVSKISKNK